jgi:selenocysteine lyase/cysteine desulfurase
MGVLFGRGELLKKMPKWNHFFISDDQVPEKFELGCMGYESAASLVGIEKYFRAVGKNINAPVHDVLTGMYRDIQAHETKLTREFLSYLANKPKVQVVGEGDPRMAEDRLSVVSFLVEDRDPEEVAMEVDKSRIGLRWGHFYAVRLLDALDLLQYKGVLRVSMVHYNSEAELARLKEVLDPVLS